MIGPYKSLDIFGSIKAIARKQVSNKPVKVEKDA